MAETEWTRPPPRPYDFSMPFWQGAKAGKLMLQYDPEAGKYQFFPRPVSVFTGKRNLEWREASGRGTVYTYTITRRAPPTFRGQEPYVVATIELEEGVRILGNIVGCAPEDVKIGMKVRVAFEDVTDEISYFVFKPER